MNAIWVNGRKKLGKLEANEAIHPTKRDTSKLPMGIRCHTQHRQPFLSNISIIPFDTPISIGKLFTYFVHGLIRYEL